MNQTTTDTIGTSERVNFPALALFNVPAKVDTGADSSAIWASDIRLGRDGRLNYVLFDEGSRFYSGERLQTKSFRTSLVKNTSGISESRYKIRLAIQIGERKIQAWFNLSDRSEMRYPVLIGRRLLHNKFVVDVSKRHVHNSQENPYKILVLGAPEHRVGDFLSSVASATEEPVQFRALSFKELIFRVEAGNVRTYDYKTGMDIADYDLVYFKTHRRNYEFAVCAAEYLERRHVQFVDRELAGHIAYDKLSEMMRLALRGICVPLTYCGSHAALLAQVDEIVADVGLPLICKEINADRGRNNYMLNSKAELAEVLLAARPDERYMVQKYIKNDGYVRALVLGPKLALVVGRKAVEHPDARKQHLNNPAGAENAYLIDDQDMPDELRETALSAARLMRRQIAGVDLVYDIERKRWVVLEVNTAPQIRSGAYQQEKIKAFAKFIDLQLNR